MQVNSSRDFNLVISSGTSQIGLKSTLRDFNFEKFKTNHPMSKATVFTSISLLIEGHFETIVPE